MSQQLIAYRLGRVEALLNAYGRDTHALKQITKACDDLCYSLLGSNVSFNMELVNSYTNSKIYALLPVRRIVRDIRTRNPSL